MRWRVSSQIHSIVVVSFLSFNQGCVAVKASTYLKILFLCTIHQMHLCYSEGKVMNYLFETLCNFSGYAIWPIHYRGPQVECVMHLALACLNNSIWSCPWLII
jgi:hypothetical protein